MRCRCLVTPLLILGFAQVGVAQVEVTVRKSTGASKRVVVVSRPPGKRQVVAPTVRLSSSKPTIARLAAPRRPQPPRAERSPVSASYLNSRFGYRIEVPPGLRLEPGTDYRDGVGLEGDRIRARIWGENLEKANLVLDYQNRLNDVRRSRSQRLFHRFDGKGYTVCWREGDWVRYERVAQGVGAQTRMRMLWHRSVHRHGLKSAEYAAKRLTAPTRRG